ncbi:MAG: glucosyl transferase [Ignavibacteriaceae bacterium]|nr:glucosyl transferase [Ignavibacteriaceae bacterium]
MIKIIEKIFYLSHVLVLLLLLVQCDTDEPPTNSALSLKLEDVSCTEAWITLTTTNLQLPSTIILKQNNQTISTINLIKRDTLLYVDSLLPNQTYDFQSIIQSINLSSNELSVTTIDTTSHNFTWQTWTFGEHDASFLWDVAILDENNIFAVGEIYLNDTLGQPDPHPYNLVVWNGSKWELLKLTYQGIPPVIHSVFVINYQDVWFDPWFHWDGQNFQELPIDPVFIGVGINRIWGNDDGIYVVGNDGFIAYKTVNGGWNRIFSGTETRINDVCGITTSQNETVLYCPVSSFFVPGDKKILKITDGKVDSVYRNRDVRLYSAWAVNENILYVCGEGVYVNKFGTWDEIDLYPVGTNSVRGNDINDIFVVGDYGTIFHFNGISWQMLSTPNNKGYSKVAVSRNIVAICGNYQGQGLIEIGIRN